MNKKIRLSFFLPEGLLKDIKEKMVEDGYDLKSKSKWINEAVKDLFAVQSYPELVHINDEMQGLEKLDSVSVDYETKQRIDSAILDIRKIYPMLEGVQSRIIRTAIVQRLIRR